MTAFVTECGKFVWNVLPQGMRRSTDYFLRITEEALRKGGLTNYVKIFDDLLLIMRSMKELAKVFQDLLKICRENKIPLQLKKIGLSSPESEPVKSAGLSVSYKGISPHEEKLEAITKMDAPK